jgi:hypothetical protein
MPGHQYTPAEYALQQKFETFGRLLFELEEHRLTHIYSVVFLFCQYEGIDYLVLRYLNMGALPFEEFSEEWLFDGEVESSSILETVSGTVSIRTGLKKGGWNWN